RMKIVMVCEFFDEKLEYQDDLLAKYYTARGYDVTIITSTIQSVFDFYADTYRGKGRKQVQQTATAKVIRLPLRINLLNRFKMYTKLTAYFDEEMPDLIFFHDPIPNIAEAAEWVKNQRDARQIMDDHADSSNSAKNCLSRRILHGTFRKYFFDKARPQISQILSVWPAGFQLLHDLYKIPYAQMELSPLGADIDYSREVRARGEGAALRSELGIKPDDLVIFTGGKLDRPKKTEDLLGAVLELNDPRIHVLLIGKPETGSEDYAESLMTMAAASPNIHVRGWARQARGD